MGKLDNKTFSKRPNNPIDVLKKGEVNFKDLSVNDQVTQLLNIIQIFGKTSGGIDLTKIGGAAKSATTRISLSIGNLSKNYHECIAIIDQSPSGLWESQSVNLLDLVR